MAALSSIQPTLDAYFIGGSTVALLVLLGRLMFNWTDQMPIDRDTGLNVAKDVLRRRLSKFSSNVCCCS